MDECFIQTIVWDQKEKLRVKDDYLRYIDWSAPRSNGNNPAILDEQDFEYIINSDAFFAEK